MLCTEGLCLQVIRNSVSHRVLCLYNATSYQHSTLFFPSTTLFNVHSTLGKKSVIQKQRVEQNTIYGMSLIWKILFTEYFFLKICEKRLILLVWRRLILLVNVVDPMCLINFQIFCCNDNPTSMTEQSEFLLPRLLVELTNQRHQEQQERSCTSSFLVQLLNE